MQARGVRGLAVHLDADDAAGDRADTVGTDDKVVLCGAAVGKCDGAGGEVDVLTLSNIPSASAPRTTFVWSKQNIPDA